MLLLLLLFLKASEGFSATGGNAKLRQTDLQGSTSYNSGLQNPAFGTNGEIKIDGNRQLLITEVKSQNSNEDAPVYDFYQNGNLKSENNIDTVQLSIVRHRHFETRSLNELFPELKFSEMFNSCELFRNELRNAIRHDMVFDDDSQPSIYGRMTKEQRYEELAKNSPLIGYWNSSSANRMRETTRVLQQYLGFNAPSGDVFMDIIGSLCQSTEPPFHWTEVVGVGAMQNKKMGEKSELAWHQDYGCVEQQQQDKKDYITNRNNHVFFGFPCENNYDGAGVFPHLIKLKHEQWRKNPDGMSSKPIFYRGAVPDQYVVRPRYISGSREIIIFRDVDVFHSSPDIQYRTSIMRFG